MSKRRISGEYNHIVDAKKRLALPAKIRECMTETMILVGSLFSPCLALYAEDEWEKFEEHIYSLSEMDALNARRKVFSRLCEVKCDVHGRILIPQNLCEYADFKRDVTVVGMGTYAEIWDKERWAQALVEADKPELLETLRKANF